MTALRAVERTFRAAFADEPRERKSSDSDWYGATAPEKVLCPSWFRTEHIAP